MEAQVQLTGSGTAPLVLDNEIHDAPGGGVLCSAGAGGCLLLGMVEDDD